VWGGAGQPALCRPVLNGPGRPALPSLVFSLCELQTYVRRAYANQRVQHINLSYILFCEPKDQVCPKLSSLFADYIWIFIIDICCNFISPHLPSLNFWIPTCLIFGMSWTNCLQHKKYRWIRLFWNKIVFKYY